MNILILGAGRVGESVAESLASERNDITVIDTDPARLAALQDRLDLRGVAGNGIQPSVLREAGIEDADLFIACAPLDETNLVACKVAHQMFNVPTTIARIRSPEFEDGTPLMTGRDGFAVDHVICPEESVTRTIGKLIEYPEALQVLEFADGPGQPGGGARGDGRAAGAAQPGRDPAARARRRHAHRRHLPPGQAAGRAARQHAHRARRRGLRARRHRARCAHVLGALRKMDRPVKRVMIAGGGKVGLRLARQLRGDGAGEDHRGQPRALRLPGHRSCPARCWCCTATRPTRS